MGVVMGRSTVPGLAAFALALVLFVPSVPARADQYVSVARISALNGTVTVKQGDSGDTVAAAINAPMIVGDYLATGNGSRAEIQIDDASFVRASEDVQLRFTRMDPTDHTLQLAAGTIEVSLIKVTDGRPQVETPSIRIKPEEAGAYRITVTSDGDTLLTVRSGQADLIAPQGTQTITQGVTVAIHGSSANPTFRTIQTIAYDDFDTWNSDRDKFAWRAYANAYASPDIVGQADLSNYGQWVSSANYGYVWAPYNQYGWAPYRYGRWSWVNNCGWTWVGYEPWGWAPYHYGRWFYAPAFGWAWYPGPRYYQSYWQPALVAFFNFGGGGGFGFGIGNIGWVPLGPYEPYYPYYNVRHVTNITNITNIVNVTHVHNIGTTYGNSRWPGGVTAVSAGSFSGGSKYQYVQVSQRDLQDVTLAKGWLPVAPTKADTRFTQSPASVAPAGPASPRFAAMPAPKEEQTFDQQRATALTIAQRMTAQAQAGATNTAKAPIAPNVPASSGATATSAWSHFGSSGGQSQAPVRTNNAPQSNAPQNNAPHTSGSTVGRDETADVWSRFGPANAPSATAGHTMPNGPGGAAGWSAFTPGNTAVHSPTYIPGMPGMMNPWQGSGAPYRYSAPSGGWSPHATNMPQPSGRAPVSGGSHGSHK
jgi:hypothetical protein